ncbi:MAG TPA: FAD-dependent oxidoreductase [Beijerinckiaceae bacterium]|nr:FAD-dependent oxidoreductase [Beijerinckiaceae bacterium]
MTAMRLPNGGLVDRTQPLRFQFDGMEITGFAGDTIASALLANDIVLAGRSFKLHRPRGFVGAGYDDGIMVDRLSPRPAPNQLAAVTGIEPGAVYRSVSTWPSARRDFGAVAGFFAPLLPAGFYYKTFMRPSWHLFEPLIRAAAGLGRVPVETWQPTSESRYGDCDVLVVGAGPAGLAAASTAGASGARVMLVDDQPSPGGRLLHDGFADQAWLAEMLAMLEAMPNVRRLPQSSVWAYHEHNLLTVIERAPSDARDLDFRTWKVRARQVVIAAGAQERPIPFPDSDRPGVMLASAARSYLHRHGVRVGARAIVFTNNDSAYATALDLAQAGSAVTVLDARPTVAPEVQARAADRGIRLRTGAQVVRAIGRARVSALEFETAQGRERLDCDLVAVSGGWNPAFHLASQSRQATSVWRPDIATFVARHASEDFSIAGAATGTFGTSDCAREGAAAAATALGRLGIKSPAVPVPESGDAFVANEVHPLWFVPRSKGAGKVFVDLSGDVSTDDLGLAMREGYDSIELIKRYTTAGMGVDQGKTGNVNVIAVVGALSGQPADAVGTTTFRPPYVPVEFGAIAGARSQARLYPWRHTPLTGWHVEQGAVMYEAGLRWQRPGYYPQPGEDWSAAAQREARAVREGVGVYDGTPLGKFQLKGPDVPRLLDLAYVGDFSKLKPRRGKYSVMMSDDGLILDDGVTFRLDEHRWLLHSSTGAADRVHGHLEQLLQVHRPDWRVSLIPVTTQWANATLCGPLARDVLAALNPDFDISNKALPFMGMVEGHVAGLPVRVFRVSWTGELSFELNTPARHGPALWQAVMQAGARFAITPVGSEANHILRVEAGYLSTGHEVDGTADVHDLGLSGLIGPAKTDFLGKRSMEIRRRADPSRFELVGLLPEQGQMVPEGAPITPGGDRIDQEGFVSACVMSVAQQRPVALGLLREGRRRMGETVRARVRDRIIAMQVVEPVFHDASRSRVKS